MSLAKLTLGTLGSQIVGIVCLTIWGMINAHILGPEGKGTVTLAFLYPELFFNLFWFSLGTPYIHHIGRARYKLANFAANSLLFAGILGGLAISVFWITFLTSSHALYPEVKGIYLFVTILLTPVLMVIYYFCSILQGSYNIRDYNLVWLAWRISGVPLIILLVFILRLGVWGAIIGGSIPIVFSGITSIYLVARITKPEDWEIEPILLRDTFMDGLKLHIGSIATFVRNRINLFILNYYLGVKEVGFFSVALTVSEMLNLIPQAASVVLWPKTAAASEEEAARLTALICRHTLLWMILGGITISVMPKLFILIFAGRAYFPSSLPLSILIPGTIISSLGTNVGGALLLTKHGKFLLATYISFALSVLNVTALFVLIPQYGLLGAALGIFITNLILGITQIFLFWFLSKRNPKELFCFTKEDILLYRNLFVRIYNKIKVYYRDLEHTES